MPRIDEELFNRVGEEENDSYQEDPASTWKDDLDLRTLIRQGLKACRQSIEDDLVEEFGESARKGEIRSRNTWQGLASLPRFGRRVFLEPSQPARVRDVILMNKACVEEGHLLTAVNTLVTQEICHASKEMEEEPFRMESEEEKTERLNRLRLSADRKLLAMRAMHQSTRQATDKLLYWSNKIPFGDASRGHRRWLPKEYESLLREVRVAFPTLNDAEYALFASLCGFPGQTEHIQKLFEEWAELGQELDTCVADLSEQWFLLPPENDGMDWEVSGKEEEEEE